MSENSKNRSFTEEIEIAGHQLIDTIRRLVAEGNVSRVRIRAEDGRVFLEIPTTAGAVTGGLVVLTAPWLAAIGAVAGLAAKARIEIVRDTPADDHKGEAGNPPPA